MSKRVVLVPLAVVASLIFLTGYLNPFGIPLPLTSIPTSEKVAVLTFDDGPSPYTLSVLNILEKTGTKATFFVLGENASRYPFVIKKMAEEGQDIENHTWSHSHTLIHSLGFLREELERTDHLIEKLTGNKPKFFRPPYGQYHLGTLKSAQQLGLSTVLWSVTGYDWLLPGPDRIQSNVLGGLKPGAIILLHDGGGNREETVQALPGIIAEAKARGFRFIPLRVMAD